MKQLTIGIDIDDTMTFIKDDLDEAAINEVLTTIFTRLNEPTKTNAEKTLLKMCSIKCYPS